MKPERHPPAEELTVLKVESAQACSPEESPCQPAADEAKAFTSSKSLAPAVLAFDSPSLARLSVRTALAVAVMLAIPDGIALIPTTSDPVSWIIKVLGLWLIALVLWYVSFLTILHILRLVSGGIAISAAGLKLGRLERLIPWSGIEAVAVEPQPVFSRIFSMTPPAVRLVLYIAKKPGGRLTYKDVPSFFFKPGDFASFCLDVAGRVTGRKPEGQFIYACQDGNFKRLHRGASRLSLQRILLTLVISAGLICFLGRKAYVNYLYNLANLDISHGYFAQAAERYGQVVSVEPTFAAAWYNLARAQYLLGKKTQAKEHWQKALAMKPDYVEAKTGLAHLYIQERKFEQAKVLLDKAQQITPNNPAVLVNLADWNMRVGHTPEAMRIARYVLTQDRVNPYATGLLAQGKIRFGKKEAALKLLNSLSAGSIEPAADYFVKLVKAEAYMAAGANEEAATLLSSLLEKNPDEPEVLIDLARARLGSGQLSAADALLTNAGRKEPHNPWIFLLKSDVCLRAGDMKAALHAFKFAVESSNQDALSLAEGARMALALGRKEEAARLAKRALALEPVTPEAVSVLELLTDEPIESRAHL